jgi:hypothetical protein
MKFGIITLAFAIGTTVLAGCSSKSSPATDTSSTSATAADTPASTTNTTGAAVATSQARTGGRATPGASQKTGTAAAPQVAVTATTIASSAATTKNGAAPTTTAPMPTLRGTGPLPPLTSGPPKLGADGKAFACKSDGDCDSSEHCSAQHTCQCATEKGFSRCSAKAACTNVKNEDANNCGACGNVCDITLICMRGKCDEDI